jgi:hypothetical protein
MQFNRQLYLFIFHILLASNLVSGVLSNQKSFPYTLTSTGNILYFGVGSNLLKSKVIKRGINGTTIDIISMRPGFASNYRLAFNLRGFPPLEPAMAGIEPCPDSSCHGSLIEFTPDNYHKLWLSEGGGQPRPSYEQVVRRSSS